MRLTAGAVSVCLAVGIAGAEAAESLRPGLSADVTMASQYLSHGFRVYDDWSCQPSAVVVCPLTGIQFQGWASLPVDRDDDLVDEWDALAKYGRVLGGRVRWAVDVHGFVNYWIYPNLELTADKDGAPISPTDKAGFKLNLGVSLPNAMSVGNVPIVPAYNAYRWLPVKNDLFESGTAHEFSLAGAGPLSRLLPTCKTGAFSAAADVTYHDGAFDVEPGWSHVSAHLATKHRLGAFWLSPGVNYQWSMEDTVNPDNAFWTTVTLSCSL